MTTATRPDVRIAERAGFCYGVRLAIDKAKHARTEGKEVTTLGQLVHNPGIKADLSDRGIRTADLADQVEGGTLVIRAHGVPKSEFEQVKGKESLEVIDATCTWVLQSQKAARELAEAGYTVCIIGHEDHPEVKGVRSYAGENHVVVDDMDRSTWERVPRTKKLGVLSQSTILPVKLEEFAAFCLRRCHDMRVVNTVCPVTLTRQDDSVKLAAEVDAMIVVGGKNSSNTKELAVKCAEIQPETVHVADADELATEHRRLADGEGSHRDHRRHLDARGRPRGGPRPDLRAYRRVTDRIVVEQHVPADPTAVHAAFTSADALARWWWPHLPDTTYAVDGRTGGAYEIRSAAAGIGVRGDFVAARTADIDPHDVDLAG